MAQGEENGEEEGLGLTRSLVPWGVCGHYPAGAFWVPSATGRLPKPEALPDVGQQGVDDTYLFLLPASLPD